MIIQIVIHRVFNTNLLQMSENQISKLKSYYLFPVAFDNTVLMGLAYTLFFERRRAIFLIDTLLVF